MTKVERSVVAEGVCHIIENAVRLDGTEPAGLFMDLLRQGKVIVNEEEQVDEYLPRDASHVKAAIKDFAEGRELPSNRYNKLRDGIWEFKSGDVRVSFYDTDGAGGFTPKFGTVKQTHWRTIVELPEFDDSIRLGHCFPKQSRTTAESDIALTKTVRLEDLSHDNITDREVEE